MCVIVAPLRELIYKASQLNNYKLTILNKFGASDSTLERPVSLSLIEFTYGRD